MAAYTLKNTAQCKSTNHVSMSLLTSVQQLYPVHDCSANPVETFAAQSSTDTCPTEHLQDINKYPMLIKMYQFQRQKNVKQK